MSVQLEVVKFRDLITVTSITRFVPNLEFPTIEIVGEDFSNVEKVEINSVPSPEFIIINKHKMWVQLPEAARDSISTIEVLSNKFTKTIDSSKVTFEIGKKTKEVSGILKLVQLFTKWILQSPGSDILNPERGGGVQSIIGRISGSKKMEPVMAAIARAVDTTTQQIKVAQSSQSNLPLDERLLTATVEGLNVYEEQMEAQVKIRLTNLTGESALSSLEL